MLLSNFLAVQTGELGLERERDGLRGPQCRPGWEPSLESLAQGLPMAPPHSRGGGSSLRFTPEDGVPDCRAGELPRIPIRELDHFPEAPAWKQAESIWKVTSW